MKRLKLFSLLVLLMTAMTGAWAQAPSGAIDGKFTINADGDLVYFAKGNLQATYDGSAWSWAFATNQWDIIGNEAANTSINGNGTISGTGTVDLFGWVGENSAFTGTAIYGITNSTTGNQYGNTKSEALKSDWGTLAISNGGNKADFGWRTLTSDEWTYVLNTRTTTSEVRYAKATVNGIVGLILLPDNWSTSYYSLTSTNTASAHFDTNVISSDDWTNSLEAHGAVFLPAGGYRDGAEVIDSPNHGFYWSATSSSKIQASRLWVQNIGINSTGGAVRTRGHSVRLVYNAPADPEPEPAGNIVTWDNTNVFNAANSGVELSKWNPDPLTFEGITISFEGNSVSSFKPYVMEEESASLECYGGNDDSFTFTAPSGKQFTKIEIINDGFFIFTEYVDWTKPELNKIEWNGTAASEVTLGGSNYTSASNLTSIVFTLADPEPEPEPEPEPATTYNVTFTHNSDVKVVENITLPHTFSCDYTNGNGELDLIIQEFYNEPGGHCATNGWPWGGNTNEVVVDHDGNNHFVTINAPFEGSTYMSGYYDGINDPNFFYTFNISIAAPEPEPQPAEDVDITPNVDPDHAGVYYSTFYDSANKYALPAGVEAYVATRDGANLLLSKIAVAGQTIPADNAVILKSSVTPFVLSISEAEAVPVNAINHLQGTDVSIPTPDNCYVLAGESGVGFYHYTASMLNPHKAYVTYSGSNAPHRMPFIFDQATGVENVQGNVQSTKVIENGVLYIIKNGVKFNAMGQVIK